MNALLMMSALLAPAADDPLKGLQCTVSAVGCVYGQLGKFDASAGLVCDLAKVGDAPAGKCKYKLELFVGLDVREKVIFVGKAGVKAGLNITCEVEMAKGPIDKAAIERTVLPVLLAHPDVKKAAGDKAIQLVPNPTVEVLSPERLKAVKGGFVPRK